MLPDLVITSALQNKGLTHFCLFHIESCSIFLHMLWFRISWLSQPPNHMNLYGKIICISTSSNLNWVDSPKNSTERNGARKPQKKSCDSFGFRFGFFFQLPAVSLGMHRCHWSPKGTWKSSWASRESKKSCQIRFIYTCYTFLMPYIFIYIYIAWNIFRNNLLDLKLWDQPGVMMFSSRSRCWDVQQVKV